MQTKRARSAFTLLEIMIAIAVFTIAGTGIWYIVQQSNRSLETISDDSEMMNWLRRAQQDIHIHLIQCNPSTLQVTTGADWDEIHFQIPIGLTAGSVVWGADNNADWEYRYEVRTEDNADNLYRVTYDAGGGERGKKHIMRGIADQTEEGKGLVFNYANRNVTTTLRIKRKLTGIIVMLERSLTFNTLLRN